MSGFLIPPTFAPPEYRIPWHGLPVGYVLTITANGLEFIAAGAGGNTGYLGTYITDAPGAGTHTNYTPTGFGPHVGRYDVDTTSGDVEFISIVAGTDGQLLNVRNIGTSNLILDVPGFQLPAQMYVPQNDAVLLCYYAGSINLWGMA